MTITPDLNGRVALVTGASRGIGAAIAALLAKAGAAVAVNYRERAKEADAVVADIISKGGRAVATAADVSQAAAVAAPAAEAARCVALQQRPDLIRSTTLFHWWPRRIRKRQGPRRN